MHYSFRRPEFGSQCSHWAAPGYPTSSYVLKGHISQNKNKGIIETQRIVWLFPSNFYVYLKKNPNKQLQMITTQQGQVVSLLLTRNISEISFIAYKWHWFSFSTTFGFNVKRITCQLLSGSQKL